MHEIKIAGDLSVIVLDAAKKENLLKVTKVNLIFGQLVQIVPEIFEFAFRETVRDTIANDAEVSIEIYQVKMKCNTCGRSFDVEGNRFECPGCHSTDLAIIQGKELFVKSIEGE